MLAHEKIRKSLASKSIGRGKSSTRIVKKPASPPKTSADIDLDNRFAAQYGRMLKKMDDRMELLSSSLLNQIRSIFDNPQSYNLYSEDEQASGLAQAQGSGNKSLPKSKLAQPINSYSDDPQRSRGNPVTKRCQSPISHMTKSASVRSRERPVCEGGTGAWLLGLA